MTTQSDFAAFLQNHGLSLQSMGLSELALTRDDLLEAARLALECQLPILGGDVYFLTGEAIEPAYANWHVERKDGESSDAFVKRSYDETIRYVKSLPKSAGKAHLFVMVTG